MRPRLISGWPKRAVSAAIRSVHAIASSQPPPSAKPLIAAITGLPSCSIESKICWPWRACSLPATGESTASSLMSAPATKAFSPLPVRTIARTPASALNAAMALASSVSVWLFRALRTFGRLRETMATAPSRSIRRLSKVMRLPPHDTPRPRGAQAQRGAGGVVPDVAPLGKTCRHVHLNPFHAHAVKHRDHERGDHRAARHAGPAGFRGRAQGQQRHHGVRTGVQHRIGEPVTDRRRHVGHGRPVIDRGHQDRYRQPEADHNGKMRRTQPSTIAAPTNVPSILAPSVSCSFGVSFAMVANTIETSTANRIIKPKWLAIYLRPRRTSYASIATSMLSRPETIRKVLPYSYEAAVTMP